MRILIATDWNSGRGGAEAQALWLRDGLEAAGDTVRLLTGSAGSAGDGRAEYIAYGSDRRAAQALLQIVNPFAVARARQALRELAPDVALVNMFAQQLSPAFLHALAGVPIVLLVSDFKCVCPVGTKLLPDLTLCRQPAGLVCLTSSCVGALHWLRDRPRYALVRSALRRVARVVACSAWVRDALAADGIPADVLILPVPSPAPGYRRTPAELPTLLCCGRLDVEKGLPLLLRAFARVHAEVPQARLRIVGRGPLRDGLRRQARDLRVDAAVTFTGWLEPAQVEAELARAWALVAPSLWAEPLGLVAPEAIVRSVPVVASATGGFAETVDDGRTGLLFPNGDESALVDRLLRVVRGEAFASHVLAPELVAAAVDRHATTRYVERLRGLCSDVIARA
jgi:glycosyltransferase involved in cell wall biosynthesis